MSVLKPKVIRRIKDEESRLIKEKITPWLMGFASGKFEIKDFYGKTIRYAGIKFNGGPRDIFWLRYIEPFLEDITNRVVSEVTRECREFNLNIETELKFVSCSMQDLYKTVYKKMAEIDQKILGEGFPNEITKRNVDQLIASMNSYLKRNVEMEILKNTSAKPSKNFLSRLWNDPVWSKVISALILTVPAFIYYLWNNWDDLLTLLD